MTRRIRFIAGLITALIGLVSLPARGQTGRTFFIDYASGSNTSPGTSTTAPWKTHPYMQSGAACTGGGVGWGGYTHQAGDRFIFKGGESWPAACFQMNVTQGGSSTSVRDYYGVDKTWFTGGSWIRPKFALAGVAPSTNGGLSGSRNVVTVSSSFTEWDNIEFVGQFIIGGHSGPSSGYDCGMYFSAGSGHLVHNGYFHDWVTDTANLNAGFSNCAGGLGQNGSSYTVTDSTFSDHNGSPVSFGGCFQNSTGAQRNHCSYVSQGALSYFGPVSDNEFDHITNACCVAPYTNGIHTNVIEQLGNSTAAVYNNIIHDNNPVGVTLLVCSQSIVYNNVLWNNHIPVIDIDTGTGFCPNPSTNTASIYNNTVVCPTGLCLRVNTKTSLLGTLNLSNNHWISDGTPVCYNNTSAGCANVTTVNASDNLTMSTSAATSQGYTISNDFMPTSSSSKTVNAALNLSVLCLGELSSLCADRLHTPRLTSWNVGAYQFGSQTASKPNPPSNLNAIVQ